MAAASGRADAPLRDEPGSMARFSLDLYRELSRVVRGAPTAP